MPARYIIHVTLDSGDARRSRRDEVADTAVAAVHDSLGRAIASPRALVPIPATDGYALSATPYGRCLIATVWGRESHGERAPLVTFGVAGHARCGAELWAALHAGRAVGLPPLATVNQSQPPPPWLGARLEPGIAFDHGAAHWIADLERVVAWAWLSRAD